MAPEYSEDLSRIQEKIDQLAAVIAFDAGLPVGQIDNGPISVEQSIDRWTKSQSGSRGTVYFTGGEDESVPSKEYDSVTIEDNGWMRCWNESDDSSAVRYPPHRILRVEY